MVQNGPINCNQFLYNLFMKFWAGFMGARFQEQILKKNHSCLSHFHCTHVHVLSIVNAYMYTILNRMSTEHIFSCTKCIIPWPGRSCFTDDLFVHCQCLFTVSVQPSTLCTLSTPRTGFFAKSTNLLDKFIVVQSSSYRSQQPQSEVSGS